MASRCCGRTASPARTTKSISEFFSIKVPNGPLTSRLQNLQEGHEIFVSRKPTGTLVLRDLRPRKRLFLLSTGTGLAPFMSLVKDPEMYERFEKIVLIHGVRTVSELALRGVPDEDAAGRCAAGRVRSRSARVLPDGDSRAVPQSGRLTDLITSGPAVRRPQHAVRWIARPIA